MDFVERMHAAADKIKRVEARLQKLAGAFDLIGNPDVANRLIDMADDLAAVNLDVRGICGEQVTAEVKRAEEASNNMLRAALAVTKEQP